MKVAIANRSIPTFVKKHITIIGVGAATGMFIHMVARGDSEMSFIYPNYIQFITAGLVTILLSFAIVANNRWLNRIAPWGQVSGKRLFLGIVANSLLLLIACRIVDFVLLIQQPENVVSSYSNKFLLLGFIAVLIYSVIYFALSSFHIYSEEKLSSIQVRREQVDLQFKALKSQLSPHFLFNGLNSISALIYSQPEIGKKFIRSFADCYKFVLGNYKQDLILVKDELAFVDAYVYLLQTRHKNNLTLTTALSAKSYDSYLPPLAIQMLVENAAKHNMITGEQKLLIEIKEDGDQIIVRNNKTARPKQVSSFNIGLDNILRRYRLLGLKDIRITDGDTFEVRLPRITSR